MQTQETYQYEFDELHSSSTNWRQITFKAIFNRINSEWNVIKSNLTNGIDGFENMCASFIMFGYEIPKFKFIYEDLAKQCAFNYIALKTLIDEAMSKNLLSFAYHCHCLLNDMRNFAGFIIDWWADCKMEYSFFY